MTFTEWVDSKKRRQSSLANVLGVTRSAINQWKKNGVPLDRMRIVRDISGGAVTFEELVPSSSPRAAARLPGDEA